MAVKFAEAHLQLTPRLGVKPTRARDAAANMELRVNAPISSAALGGDAINVTIKGQHAQEVMQLLVAIQQGGEIAQAAIDRLKELHEADSCDSAPDAREDGSGTP